MKITKLFVLFALTILTISITSCKKDDDEKAELTVYTTIEGDFLEDVEVTLRYSDDGSEADFETTNFDGEVIFYDITPGEYYIDAEITTFSNTTLGDALFTHVSGDFELSSGQEKTMYITLLE